MEGVVSIVLINTFFFRFFVQSTGPLFFYLFFSILVALALCSCNANAVAGGDCTHSFSIALFFSCNSNRTRHSLSYWKQRLSTLSLFFSHALSACAQYPFASAHPTADASPCSNMACSRGSVTPVADAASHVHPLSKASGRGA